MAGTRSVPLWLALLVPAVLGGLVALGPGSKYRNRLFADEAVGQELSFTGWADSRGVRPTATGAPLYPLVLKAMGGVPGSVAKARRHQMVLLSILIPLLTAWAASRAFGAGPGLLAGLLAFLPGSFWLHTGWLVPAAWQAALLLLIAGVAAGASPPGNLRILVMGLLIGLARLMGAAWAPLLAILWILYLLSRLQLTRAALLAAGASVMLLTPLLGPREPGSTATPALLNGGFEAALGFHEGASGMDPRRSTGDRWQWLTARDHLLALSRRDGRKDQPEKFSSTMYVEAFRWSVENPGGALSLMARKALIQLGGYDPPSPESLGFRARQTIPWARFLLPLASIVMGFGLAGLWAAARGSVKGKDAPPDIAAFMAPAAAIVLTAAFFYVRSGDRFSLLMVLLAPAAHALWLVADPSRPKEIPSRPLWAIGVLLSALSAVPWFGLAPRLESEAEDRFLVGTTLDRLGRTAEAIGDLETAARLDPAHAGARMALAGALMRDGLNDQAVLEIREAIRLSPELTSAWRSLAVLLQNGRRYEESAEAWKELARLDPYNPEVRNNLGTLFAALGRYEDCIAALKQALAINPNYREAAINLSEIEKRGPEGLSGVSLQTGTPAAGGTSQLQKGILAAMQALQAGDVAGAGKKLAELRASFGASPELDFASGNLELQRNNVPAAIEFFERAKNHLGTNPILLNNLATAYARSGNLAAAAALWEEILKADPTHALARQNLDAARRQQQQGQP